MANYAARLQVAFNRAHPHFPPADRDSQLCYKFCETLSSPDLANKLYDFVAFDDLTLLEKNMNRKKKHQISSHFLEERESGDAYSQSYTPKGFPGISLGQGIDEVIRTLSKVRPIEASQSPPWLMSPLCPEVLLAHYP